MKKLFLSIILFICLIPFHAQTMPTGLLGIWGDAGGAACSYTAQDYTSGWAEADATGEITIDSATQVSVVDFDKNSDNYFTLDGGAAYYSGDFAFRQRITLTGPNDNWVRSYVWGVANELDDFKGIEDGAAETDDYIGLRHDNTDDGKEYLELVIVEDGSEVATDAYEFTISQEYYILITRDDDAGANSTGQVKAYIYTGSYGGTLQDTLSVDCSAAEQNDFRYLYQIASWNNGAANNNTDFTITNLEEALCIP